MFTHPLFCLLSCLSLFFFVPPLNYPSVIHPPTPFLFFFFFSFCLFYFCFVFLLLFSDVASLTASVHAPSGPVPAQTQFPWQQILPQLQVIYPYPSAPPPHLPTSPERLSFVYFFKPLVFHCVLHACCELLPVSRSVTCRSWFLNVLFSHSSCYHTDVIQFRSVQLICLNVTTILQVPLFLDKIGAQFGKVCIHHYFHHNIPS